MGIYSASFWGGRGLCWPAIVAGYLADESKRTCQRQQVLVNGYPTKDETGSQACPAAVADHHVADQKGKPAGPRTARQALSYKLFRPRYFWRLFKSEDNVARFASKFHFFKNNVQGEKDSVL